MTLLIRLLLINYVFTLSNGLSGNSFEHGNGTSKGTADSKPTTAQIWGIGLSFVTVISVSSCAGIALLPLLSETLYHKLLTYFVGLGVGSLSGSAVFHLVPHAFLLGKPGTGEHLQKPKQRSKEPNWEKINYYLSLKGDA